MGKTKPCIFCDFKIFPGHGSTVVRRDGTVAQLINSKAKSLYFQKKKASRLAWTTAWRLLHKKGQSFNVRRRVKRGKGNRVVKRGIAGLSMKDIRNRRTKIKTQRKKNPKATTGKKVTKAVKYQRKQQARSTAAKFYVPRLKR